MTSALVTVSGIDGSGKSEWARRLLAACAAKGVVTRFLATDDFRRPVTWQVPGRSELDIYYDDYFDLAGFDGAVSAARAAADAGTVLVVEGIMLRRVPSLAEAFAIYLETTRATAYARMLERALGRGLSHVDAVHRITARYFPAQDRYQAAFAPAEHADLLVDNEDYEHPRILRGDVARAPTILRAPLRACLASVHK